VVLVGAALLVGAASLAVVQAAGPTSFPNGIIAGPSAFSAGTLPTTAVQANGQAGTAVVGIGATSNGVGVHAEADGTQGIGVDAFGVATGVRASSTNGIAVAANSPNSLGVNATGGQIAVRAYSPDRGVQTNSDNGAALIGNSTKGQGVRAISSQLYGGEFAGGKAPIRLQPASTVGPPQSGTHQRGELYVDSNGDLFFCQADSVNGSVGTWKKVSL
jgi:hypothetical protein